MKINIPKLIRRKKLRASTARRSLALPNDVDYEEMSEPNMKLSRALLIVLVLHVVAVAGIIAFNAIKTRQGSLPPPTFAQSANAKIAEATPAATPDAVANEPEHTTVAREDHKTETAKRSPKNSIIDSGKIYVVAKGDNPVTIARKLKVSYDSLVEINHIDDPRKLKIGQKLLVPAKTSKAKKSDDAKK
jgi:LysM repeat protein